MIKQSVR